MDIKSQKARARLQAKAKRAEAQDPASAYELIQHFPAPQFRKAVVSGFWPKTPQLLFSAGFLPMSIDAAATACRCILRLAPL